MIKKAAHIFILFLFPLPFLMAEDGAASLETLVKAALAADRDTIQARRDYETSLIDQKYNYLQWWIPSFGITNDLVYPYEKEDFGDVTTSNESAVSLSLPLPTGTAITFASSYTLDRALLDDSLPAMLHWGFAQTLQGKIGLTQSLNPWWLHLRKNPYKNGAGLQNQMAKNSYGIATKNMLLTCVQNYISLRKAERNKKQLSDTLAAYDELMAAYQKMQERGSISWREYYDVRNDKWEYEQELFALENELNTIQGNIFQVTGIRVRDVHDAALPEIDNVFFMQ